MARRDRKTRRWVLTGMLLASVLMALAGRRAMPLRALASYVLIPGSDAGLYMATWLRSRVGEDSQEGLSLEAQRLLLADRDVWQARAMQYEAELRRLSNFQANFGPVANLQHQLIPARVLMTEPLPYGQTRLVNVGDQVGVLPGDQVTTRTLVTDRSKAIVSSGPLYAVSSEALVGRLGNTGRFWARLVLVTDTNFEATAYIGRVPDGRMVRMERPGGVADEPLTRDNNVFVRCTARGNGSDAVLVDEVDVGDAVKVGDRLFVFINGVVQDAWIPIGEIVEVVDDPVYGAGFQQLRVRPAADLAALRRVYILCPSTGAARGGP
jgi:cell shape-determining protein MreC